MIPTIQIVNHSTVPLPFTLEQLLVAAREYAAIAGSVWNLAGQVVLGQDGSFTPEASIWPLILCDTAPQRGTLGYHTVQGSRPTGFACLQETLADGVSLSEPILHELLEMWNDPWCQAVYPGVADSYWAGEPNDPVEGTTWKATNGLDLPNFVYPAWFGLANHDGSMKFDHLGLCAQPWQILPTGYALNWTALSGWQSAWGGPAGKATAMRKLATHGSRAHRRRNP